MVGSDHRAITYTHSQGVGYYMYNLLLNEDDAIKLCDLGRFSIDGSDLKTNLDTLFVRSFGRKTTFLQLLVSCSCWALRHLKYRPVGSHTTICQMNKWRSARDIKNSQILTELFLPTLLPSFGVSGLVNIRPQATYPRISRM